MNANFDERFAMQSYVALAVVFALSLAANAGEKSQPPAKGQAAAPAKAQSPAPAKTQDGKGATVAKTEAVVPLTNREKKQLDLYKKVEIVTVNAPCCESCSSCNPPRGGLFSRLRARRAATAVSCASCENCSK